MMYIMVNPDEYQQKKVKSQLILFMKSDMLIVSAMKAIKNMFLISLLCTGIITSCTEEKKDNCIKPGYGLLKLSNGSNTTIHKILIDGTNYGTLDPGETGSYLLPAGQHTFESVGISGGGGCGQASVIMVACSTEARICKY